MTDAEFHAAYAHQHQNFGPSAAAAFANTEACRARREERQLQDRIHALEVQQADLIRQVKEKDAALHECDQALRALTQIDEMRQQGLASKDAAIKALADALERLRRSAEPYRERVAHVQARRELWNEEAQLLRVCDEADAALRLVKRAP